MTCDAAGTLCTGLDQAAFGRSIFSRGSQDGASNEQQGQQQQQRREAGEAVPVRVPVEGGAWGGGAHALQAANSM